MGCQDFFQDMVVAQQDSDIYLFDETSCQGDYMKVSNPGRTSVKPFQSFIVPENYQIRLGKSVSGLTVHFDHQLWGIYVDDVTSVVDVWDGPHGTQHDSYDEVDVVDIRVLGERDHVLAGSCVGLQDPPVYNHEPEVDGHINPVCEDLLDIYCQSSDSYSRDMCKHRITYTPNMSKEYNDKDEWSILLIVIIFATVLICIFIMFPSIIGIHKTKKTTILTKSII